ncbi:MAG: pyrroline-5-carboxylate reductase [Chloroflexota bacterium]
MKITFIGGGNMGEAILSSVLAKHLTTPKNITVSDINEERRRILKEKHGVNVTTDNITAVAGSDMIVMAIKPQNLGDVLPGLKKHLLPEQVVLSIIAGARIEILQSGLNHRRIVRAMPNTPAQIGEGITVWITTSEVTSGQAEQAKAILSVMGKEIQVFDEKYLDMATAVSASGPAYVFLFMEAINDAALSIGLPEDMAKELVMRLLVGSSLFAEKSDRTLADLRIMVTSPGGTTAEALAVFEKRGFRDMIHEAVLAAYKKAQILGR